MVQVAEIQQFGSLSQFLPRLRSQNVHSFEMSPHPETAAYRVAILEGNASLARLLATGLLAESVSVHIHEGGTGAMQQMQTRASDMLILDLDLEGVESFALLANLREAQPSMLILALSGRAGTEQAIAALNQGADDYLQKPFSLLEMLARVRALRRRSREVVSRPNSIESRIVLQKDHARVKCNEQFIDLTPRECELLEFMMANTGTILSRTLLSQQVWNMPAEANTNIVDVYVKYLRDKLESACQQKVIRTVRGVGYVFQPQT